MAHMTTEWQANHVDFTQTMLALYSANDQDILQKLLAPSSASDHNIELGDEKTESSASKRKRSIVDMDADLPNSKKVPTFDLVGDDNSHVEQDSARYKPYHHAGLGTLDFDNIPNPFLAFKLTAPGKGELRPPEAVAYLRRILSQQLPSSDHTPEFFRPGLPPATVGSHAGRKRKHRGKTVIFWHMGGREKEYEYHIVPPQARGLPVHEEWRTDIEKKWVEELLGEVIDHIHGSLKNLMSVVGAEKLASISDDDRHKLFEHLFEHDPHAVTICTFHAFDGPVDFDTPFGPPSADKRISIFREYIKRIFIHCVDIVYAEHTCLPKQPRKRTRCYAAIRRLSDHEDITKLEKGGFENCPLPPGYCGSGNNLRLTRIDDLYAFGGPTAEVPALPDLDFDEDN